MHTPSSRFSVRWVTPFARAHDTLTTKPPHSHASTANFGEHLFHALGSIRISALRMPEASSSTLDTVWRVKNCETCFSPALARWRGRDEHRDSVMYRESLGTH